MVRWPPMIGMVVFAIASAAAAPDDKQADKQADKPGDLVEVSSVIPDAVIDLRYATTNNFVGEALYPRAVCKLRRSVLARLAKAAGLLRTQDRRLLVWDCYRPASIQQLLWDKTPDRRYVANPKHGSNHSRGAAIDLALVDQDGAAVTLPTPFDDFTKAAHRVNALHGPSGVEARRLDAAMKKAGFIGISLEWWHFDAANAAKFPLSNEPL